MGSRYKTERRTYMRRCEKVDIEYNNKINITPFLNAMKYSFNLGGVHPVVLGAFGETDERSFRMIKRYKIYSYKSW